jgi:hypothetical protein
LSRISERMKLVVPLMIPAIHSMRLAVRPFAQRLDDRDAAGDSGFESDHDALFLGSSKDLVAVLGEQGLVGGDHVLAVVDRLQHEDPGDVTAADQFDDDVDLGIADDGKSVVGHPAGAAGELPGPFEIAIGNDADLDRATGPARDLFSVALEHRVGAATDGADAEKSNVDRFHRAVRSKGCGKKSGRVKTRRPLRPVAGALAISGQKTGDARNGVAQIVFVGQEDEAEVIGRRPVEAAALNQQHALFAAAVRQ